MECNLGWNHTRDFKIGRARSASAIWNHKYDFRPKLHDSKFNHHFIRSILKSHNLIAQISTNIFSTKLPHMPYNGFFVFHFPAMWLVSLKKPLNLIGCFALWTHSHWLRKRCDVEQKIVRFVHRSAESQSRSKDNQWFQNGLNKGSNRGADSQSHSRIFYSFDQLVTGHRVAQFSL